MSARRLSALVTGLPAGGNFDVSQRGAAALWTTDHELAALNVEMLSGFVRLFVQANSKRGAQLPDVLRVPRPRDVDTDDGPPRMATPDELAAFARATGGTVRPVPREPEAGVMTA